jgi:hypothetical protein
MIINSTYRPYQQNKQPPLYTVMGWLFVLLIWHIGGIDDHHCIERWLFVLLIWPIGRIDDHHCIEREQTTTSLYSDDHHSTYRPYQQNKQPPLYTMMIIILPIGHINKTNNHITV